MVNGKSQLQIQCEANGGRFDGEKCIMPDKTPEQIEKEKEQVAAQIAEGQTHQEFISQREKLKAQGLTGIEATSQIEQRQALSQQESAATAQAQEVERQQQELQTTGAPVRRELDPTLEPGEDIPVFGPFLTKIQKVTLPIAKRLGLKTNKDFFELQPEELKTAALSQIETNEIERGLTDSEKFGSFVESLSLGGMSNFAAEKPSENVQTVLRQVKTVKTRATTAEIRVKDGTWRQAYGEEVITGLENDLQRFESRMKLLIQDSPELKFDSDGVNFIEDKIFEARERVFNAKINMVEGAATDPSDIQTLIALQDSIQEEDFELK